MHDPTQENSDSAFRSRHRLIDAGAYIVAQAFLA